MADQLENKNNIASQLLDVEIMYLVNQGPKRLSEIRTALAKVFGIEPEMTTITLRVRELTAKGFVMKLETNGDAIYALTSEGHHLLGEFIESISQIALTMQLGLNQKLVRT